MLTLVEADQLLRLATLLVAAAQVFLDQVGMEGQAPLGLLEPIMAQPVVGQAQILLQYRAAAVGLAVQGQF